MNNPVERIFLILVCVFAALASGCATTGVKENAQVDLSGVMEVPNGVNTQATGRADINVGESGWVRGHVWLHNVAATSVDISEGTAGTNGPLLISLVQTRDGEWVVPRGTRLTRSQHDEFMAANLYINVHTTNYPAGEIRGQINAGICRANFAPTAPEPAAEVAPPPPPPAPQRITFSADTLFSFNKAVLRPEGRAKLDDFADKLNGTTYRMISVVGYTDRIGSDAYNLRLSVKRADSVKDYLVNKGIPTDRIRTEGKGKSDPVTGPDACRMGNRRELINCLQPDRRVEIEVRVAEEPSENK
jgi:OOP family OmpA-OmpF porin